MASSTSSLRVWIVDPISYSGMAYTDAAQAVALAAHGARPLVVSSDGWILAPGLVPRTVVFRGTGGPRSRLQRGVSYIVSLARLVRSVRRRRPDVVHWQYLELPIADVLAQLTIRALGIRQAYTAHELLPWTRGWMDRWLFSRLYRQMDAVIVHDEAQRKQLMERFPVAPDRVHVIPLGDYSLFAAPNLDQAQSRERVGLAVDQPVALFFGTIRPSKGLEVLLAAWQSVVRAIPNARLLVVGKPFKAMDPAEIHALVDRLGIGSSVLTRLEQVDPAETNAYYRSSDVVVLPYHEIGTSGVLRYAYNSERPVVATSVGEHRIHVVQAETGFLVPPGDPAALANALVSALRDRPRLRDMGRAARAYSAGHFAWADSARQLLEVYRTMLD